LRREDEEDEQEDDEKVEGRDEEVEEKVEGRSCSLVYTVGKAMTEPSPLPAPLTRPAKHSHVDDTRNAR
jgi:hypothetical protein